MEEAQFVDPFIVEQTLIVNQIQTLNDVLSTHFYDEEGFLQKDGIFDELDDKLIKSKIMSLISKMK